MELKNALELKKLIDEAINQSGLDDIKTRMDSLGNLKGVLIEWNDVQAFLAVTEYDSTMTKLIDTVVIRERGIAVWLPTRFECEDEVLYSLKAENLDEAHVLTTNVNSGIICALAYFYKLQLRDKLEDIDLNDT